MKRAVLACAIAGAFLALAGVPWAQGPSASDKIAIDGWALNMSNVATGANQSIRITIDRWSSPAQRDRLIEVFVEKKQEGLLRALEKEPVLGRFNYPGYMGPDPNNTMRLGTRFLTR